MIFGDFSDWTIQNVIIRILVSTLLGSLIGFDRAAKHRGAGTKTITVVCLGATLVMLTEQYIQINFPGLANMTRMSAQVISGVGFLGVGTIIISNHQVKGLTTAASLWTCACIGLATGIGFIDGGILITLMMLFSLHVLPFFERFANKKSCYFPVVFDVYNGHDIHKVIKFLKENNISISSMEVFNSNMKKQPTSVYVVLKTEKHTSGESLYGLLNNMDEIDSVDIL